MVWFRWVAVSAILIESRQEEVVMLGLLTSLELCLEAIFGHVVWGVCDT